MARWCATTLCIALLLGGCKDSDSKGGRGEITFGEHVGPIVWKNCSACHRPGEAGPFSLISYDDVRKRAKDVARVTASRYMPPWLPEPGHGEFADERRLSEAEIEMIRKWVEGGCAQGKPASPPVWKEGWQLGEPDLVAAMPASYVLPGSGKDVYRNFVVPVSLPASKWVKGVELRFGDGGSKVVHHAFVKVDMSGTARKKDAADAELGYAGMEAGEGVSSPGGHFLSWQPGRVARMGEEAFAWRLNKGAELVLQLHMRPIGKSQEVQCRVGLHFSEKPGERAPFLLVLRPAMIDIPAGEKNYIVESSYVLPVDCVAIGVLPHAHYLGKELSGSATLPDGSSRPLILIKQWNFDWQSEYVYAKPVALPKGTRVGMRFSFDNSAENVRNPNQPPKTVRYGPMSSDEMAELWVQLVPKRQEDLAVLARDYTEKYSIPDAIERCRGVLKYSPEDAEMRAKLGTVLAKSGKVEEGLAELRRAVEIEPKSARIHYIRGATLAGVGKWEEAVEAYETVLKLDPEDFRTHNNLGAIYMSGGALDVASRHFYNAVRINPQDVMSNANLARVFVAQGRWGQAKLQLEEVLRIDSEDGFAKEMMPKVREMMERER